LLLGVAAAGALLVALATAWLRPSPARRGAQLALAFLAPALLYGVYAAAVVATRPTSWSLTFWVGLVAAGGLAGLLVAAVGASDPAVAREP
jgi:hypothetical protein